MGRRMQKNLVNNLTRLLCQRLVSLFRSVTQYQICL